MISKSISMTKSRSLTMSKSRSVSLKKSRRKYNSPDNCAGILCELKKKKKKGLHFHAGALSTDKQKCVCGGGGGRPPNIIFWRKLALSMTFCLFQMFTLTIPSLFFFISHPFWSWIRSKFILGGINPLQSSGLNHSWERIPLFWVWISSP